MLIMGRRSKSGDICIRVNPDSVCMGDDCDSHEEKLYLSADMRLSELMRRLAGYVPPMKNVIWAVRSEAGICGYIITDSDANASFELCGTDRTVEEMRIREIMCKYYHSFSFSWIDGKTGNEVEKYSECRTLLEKVKKDNE